MKKILFLLIAVFLITKFMLLINCIHIIHDIDGAECRHAHLAYQVLSAGNTFGNLIKTLQPQNLINYQRTNSQAGGSLVVALLYIPIACFFGISYFSLKLCSLLFSTGTLVMWSVFLYTFYDKKTALVFSLFFIFPSVSFQKWTLTVWGGHPESLFWSILIIYLFFNIIFNTSSKHKLLMISLFGFFSGFALYFSYFCLIPIATCSTIFIFINKEKYSLKQISSLCIFFMIGLSPSLVFNFFTGFEGFKIGDPNVQVPFYLLTSTGSLHRLKNYLLYGPIFPPLFPLTGVKNFYIASFLTYAHKVLYFSSIIYLVFLVRAIKYSKKKLIIIFILLYLTIFYTVISFASISKDYLYLAERYYIPVFPFIYACITIAICDITSRTLHGKILHCLRFIFICPAFIILFLSVRDNYKLLSLGEKKAILKYQGLNYYFHGMSKVDLQSANDINYFLTFIENDTLPKNKSKNLLNGFRLFFQGTARYWTLPDFTPNISDIEAVLATIPYYFPDYQHRSKPLSAAQTEFLQGLGWGLGVRCYWKQSDYQNAIKNLPETWQAAAIMGIDTGLQHRN